MKTAIFGASLALCALLAQAQTASHQYRLDGNLLDDMGGSALISHGGSLDTTGYSFGANQGLEMSAALGSVYTIDLSFHFDTQGDWQKIVDFKALAADSGMYREGDLWSFYPVVSGGPVLAAVDARLTLTRDAAGMLLIYGNGALVHTVDDSSNAYADFGSLPAYFFIDDGATLHEASPGRVDYIRTYDMALSATQVANLSAVPEPASALLALLGLAAVLPVVRRQTRARNRNRNRG